MFPAQAIRKLSDREDAIYRALIAAAEADLPCPTQDDLLEVIGNEGGVSTTVNIVQRLERFGLVKVDRFQRSRRVTILATGKSTAEPMNQSPHWRDRPRDIPTPSIDTVRRRSPELSAQIFAQASRLGKPVAEYLADLVWLGWRSEQGHD